MQSPNGVGGAEDTETTGQQPVTSFGDSELIHFCDNACPLARGVELVLREAQRKHQPPHHVNPSMLACKLPANHHWRISQAAAAQCVLAMASVGWRERGEKRERAM